jgi:hypothetical protein
MAGYLKPTNNEMHFPCSVCELQQADFFWRSKFTGVLLGVCPDCKKKAEASGDPEVWVHEQISRRQ